MVLGARAPGRVGRRRITSKGPSPRGGPFVLAGGVAFGARHRARHRGDCLSARRVRTRAGTEPGSGLSARRSAARRRPGRAAASRPAASQRLVQCRLATFWSGTRMCPFSSMWGDVLDVAVRGQDAVLVLAAEQGELDRLALVLRRVVLHRRHSSTTAVRCPVVVEGDQGRGSRSAVARRLVRLQLAAPAMRRRSWPARPTAWETTARTVPPWATTHDHAVRVRGRQPLERRHHPRGACRRRSRRRASRSRRPATAGSRSGSRSRLLAGEPAPVADVHLAQPRLEHRPRPVAAAIISAVSPRAAGRSCRAPSGRGRPAARPAAAACARPRVVQRPGRRAPASARRGSSRSRRGGTSEDPCHLRQIIRCARRMDLELTDLRVAGDRWQRRHRPGHCGAAGRRGRARGDRLAQPGRRGRPAGRDRRRRRPVHRRGLRGARSPARSRRWAAWTCSSTTSARARIAHLRGHRRRRAGRRPGTST